MKKKSIEKILKWFKSMENEEYKFPKTKKELFKLERLDLCCFCHRVPKEIAQLKNIKKLTVNVRGIDGALPKQIKYFKNLEELNLGLTYLKKIHPNLYKLKKLRKYFSFKKFRRVRFRVIWRKISKRYSSIKKIN